MKHFERYDINVVWLCVCKCIWLRLHVRGHGQYFIGHMALNRWQPMRIRFIFHSMTTCGSHWPPEPRYNVEKIEKKNRAFVCLSFMRILTIHTQTHTHTLTRAHAEQIYLTIFTIYLLSMFAGIYINYGRLRWKGSAYVYNIVYIELHNVCERAMVKLIILIIILVGI